MKKLHVAIPQNCKACLQCVIACSNAFYKKFDPDLSCIQIVEKKGAPKATVCSQCGKCAKVCEAGAITQKPNGVYMINKKLCTGCGQCVEACPFHVMVMQEGALAPSKCIACGICVKACPMQILEIQDSEGTANFT